MISERLKHSIIDGASGYLNVFNGMVRQSANPAVIENKGSHLSGRRILRGRKRTPALAPQ